MSGENTATCRDYAPGDLVKGLRELAQIGIVNHKHDTALLTAAAEYIEILTRSVDRFLAEQLRKGIEELTFAACGGETASFGVAQAMPHEAADPLLVRADAALYEAKRAGKNRVCEADS